MVVSRVHWLWQKGTKFATMPTDAPPDPAQMAENGPYCGIPFVRVNGVQRVMYRLGRGTRETRMLDQPDPGAVLRSAVWRGPSQYFVCDRR